MIEKQTKCKMVDSGDRLQMIPNENRSMMDALENERSFLVFTFFSIQPDRNNAITALKY